MLDRMFLKQQSGGPPLYVEDVFSTWLYTGNDSTQTITNGIDLAGKGGMIWFKSRSGARNHAALDTARGNNRGIFPNLTAGEDTAATISYNSNGFSFVSGNFYNINASGQSMASWTFREAPKFFDVVTYTGNGSASQTINHNLGAVPGCIIFKRTDGTSDWPVYHRGNQYAPAEGLALNLTASTGSTYRSLNSAPTETTFTVGAGVNPVNVNGATYVAYLYAHDTSSTGLIQCGSSVIAAGGTGTVTLGWEPQWILIKKVNGAQDWYVIDNMRGFTVVGQNDEILEPNTADAAAQTQAASPTATGFTLDGWTAGDTWIYVAIRRGPMKTPTVGTSVFTPISRTGTSSAATVTTSFTPDFVLTKATTGTYQTYWWNAVDRLRAVLQGIFTNTTTAESTVANGLTTLSTRSFSVGTDFNYNDSGTTYINYAFGRAPGFFDEVCYTGTGSATTFNHNLGVAPELMIFKRRNSSGGWLVTSNFTPTTMRYGFLQTTAAVNETSYSFLNILLDAPTATSFTLRNNDDYNTSGGTYVNYLFASCPGVSKVGSYTGTGALQTINCGFTSGARFVLIKRADSTGDWYVWDSARGITGGNDPYSVLNDFAGQVAGTNYVDTAATGFQVTAAAPAALNASGGTYIFLAIA